MDSFKMNYRGVKIAHQIVKAYSSALNIGTKFVYQTVPRMLTLWLDIGEDPALSNTDAFGDIQQTLQLAIRKGKIYAVCYLIYDLLRCILIDLHTSGTLLSHKSYRELAIKTRKFLSSYQN